MKRTVILVQRHSTTTPNSLVNCIGASSDCRCLCSFAVSLFNSVYLCSAASLFLYKRCHLDAVPPDCSCCKHVHWVERNCCFSFLNRLLDSTREQTTCFCSLNMYVAFHFLQINIFCRKSKYNLFAFLMVGKDPVPWLSQVRHCVQCISLQRGGTPVI